MALEKAGGYYFDTGASGKIVSGDIKVKNGEIDYFDGPNVVFKDGTSAQPDTVVFATGERLELALSRIETDLCAAEQATLASPIPSALPSAPSGLRTCRPSGPSTTKASSSTLPSLLCPALPVLTLLGVSFAAHSCRGASRESGIPNMYFLVGNLSAARLNSKMVALQIKAQQLGIFGERYTMERQGKAQANGFH